MIHLCFDSHAAGQLTHLRLIDGLPRDTQVLCLEENLSLGRLGPPALRLRELERLGTEVGEDFLRSYARFFAQAEQLPTDEPWYLWASPSPHERMGLYFVAAHYGAKVPRFLVCDRADLPDTPSAAAVAARMQAAEPLPTVAYADQWDRWRREQSLLRVGDARCLRTVPLTFFDACLREAMEDLGEGSDAFAIAARVYTAYGARYHGVFSIEFLLWRVQALWGEQS